MGTSLSCLDCVKADKLTQDNRVVSLPLIQTEPQLVITNNALTASSTENNILIATTVQENGTSYDPSLLKFIKSVDKQDPSIMEKLKKLSIEVEIEIRTLDHVKGVHNCVIYDEYFSKEQNKIIKDAIDKSQPVNAVEERGILLNKLEEISSNLELLSQEKCNLKAQMEQNENEFSELSDVLKKRISVLCEENEILKGKLNALSDTLNDKSISFKNQIVEFELIIEGNELKRKELKKAQEEKESIHCKQVESLEKKLYEAEEKCALAGKKLESTLKEINEIIQENNKDKSNEESETVFSSAVALGAKMNLLEFEIFVSGRKLLIDSNSSVFELLTKHLPKSDELKKSFATLAYLTSFNAKVVKSTGEEATLQLGDARFVLLIVKYLMVLLNKPNDGSIGGKQGSKKNLTPTNTTPSSLNNLFIYNKGYPPCFVRSPTTPASTPYSSPHKKGAASPLDNNKRPNASVSSNYQTLVVSTSISSPSNTHNRPSISVSSPSHTYNRPSTSISSPSHTHNIRPSASVSYSPIPKKKLVSNSNPLENCASLCSYTTALMNDATCAQLAESLGLHFRGLRILKKVSSARDIELGDIHSEMERECVDKGRISSILSVLEDIGNQFLEISPQDVQSLGIITHALVLCLSLQIFEISEYGIYYPHKYKTSIINLKRRERHLQDSKCNVSNHSVFKECTLQKRLGAIGGTPNESHLRILRSTLHLPTSHSNEPLVVNLVESSGAKNSVNIIVKFDDPSEEYQFSCLTVSSKFIIDLQALLRSQHNLGFPVICFLCDRVFSIKANLKKDESNLNLGWLQSGHDIARAKNGTDDLSNQYLICENCNTKMVHCSVLDIIELKYEDPAAFNLLLFT